MCSIFLLECLFWTTLCAFMYAFVCRRQTLLCVLASKVLRKLYVPHNSVLRVHNLYMRHSFHPCSLHFISWSFNECKNKKAAEQPGAVIMSVFISNVKLGLFNGGWRNLREKKGQESIFIIVPKAASTI